MLYSLSGTKPNLSRRPPTATLYAFPSFDKCDSLVYFPSTFARHINTGDVQGIEKLLSSHATKDCDVRMCFSDLKLTTRTIVQMYKILDAIRPDSFMVMHSTKIVENEVRALVYVKATDNKAIHDTVSKSITDPLFAPLFNTARSDGLKMVVDMQRERTYEEREKLLDLARSDEDLVVYVQTEFVLRFDDITKKVTHFSIRTKTSSLEPIVHKNIPLHTE